MHLSSGDSPPLGAATRAMRRRFTPCLVGHDTPPQPLARRRAAFLVVLSGRQVGAVFELTVGESTLGRSRRANVRLDDDGVSRIHAKIVYDADGTVKLVDLRSTNGTFLNGGRIHAEGLREGDRIRLGDRAVLGFHDDHPALSLPSMAESSEG